MAVLVGAWFLILACFVVFSFGLTDPNLVLSSWQPYWDFQQWAWQVFFLDRAVLVGTYFVLVFALFVLYALILQAVRLGRIQRHQLVLLCVGSAVVLSFSYNALSHDIFNYAFNARMVVEYGVNPHLTTALSFPDDLWTRFMHNTHTTAPYGYLWTGLSVVVYLLGMGKFLLTWLLFKGMGLVSYGLLVLLYLRFFDRQKRVRTFELALLFLNPLLLIEVVSSAHNDLWMMVPALVSLWILATTQRRTFKNTVLSASLLAVSGAVKVVTIVLVPLWLLLLITKNNWFSGVIARAPQLVRTAVALSTRYWPECASMALFVPLLTERSQYFHPWYLLWSLVWLPLIEWKPWKVFLLVLSGSSLLRYIPWLLAGGFPPEVLVQQKFVTWTPLILVTIGTLVVFVYRYFQQKTH